MCTRVWWHLGEKNEMILCVWWGLAKGWGREGDFAHKTRWNIELFTNSCSCGTPYSKEILFHIENEGSLVREGQDSMDFSPHLQQPLRPLWGNSWGSMWLKNRWPRLSTRITVMNAVCSETSWCCLGLVPALKRAHAAEEQTISNH